VTKSFPARAVAGPPGWGSMATNPMNRTSITGIASTTSIMSITTPANPTAANAMGRRSPA